MTYHPHVHATIRTFQTKKDARKHDLIVKGGEKQSIEKAVK